MKKRSELKKFVEGMFGLSILGFFLLGIIVLLSFASEEITKELLRGKPKQILIWPAVNCLVIAIISKLILKKITR